ncbi:restriction endonuclease subunit S, partial [archaeon]|nr:restriction endonuclease subunit S [archaeon]
MKTKLPEGWKEKIFIDCIEKEASSNKLKIPKQNFLEEGKYAIIDQGNKYIAGYTNDEDKIYSGILPIIIFGDHTRKFKFIDFKFALGADGTKILIPKKGINPKYFYYFLKNLKIPNHGYSRHYKFLKEAK